MSLDHKILFSLKDFQEFVFNFHKENWESYNLDMVAEIFGLERTESLLGGEEDDEYPDLKTENIIPEDKEYMQFPGILVHEFDSGYDRAGNYEVEVIYYIPLSQEELEKMLMASKGSK